MTLSQLALVLGIGFAVPNLYAVTNPGGTRSAVRKFPRSLPWGFALMIAGTIWFLYYLQLESISDFAKYKPIMIAAFAGIGVGTCIYLQDFLAVRGLAIVLMLLAKFTLDTQRWQPSQWRLVLAVWAYLWVIVGIWLTISPWRLRDWIDWHTATDQRLRIGSGLRAAFGLLVATLGLTVF
jgi:hypothetical protein